MSRSSNSSGGVGILSLLTLLFLGLKLAGEISWSWWWVFSPLWIPLGIFLVVVLTIIIVKVAYDTKDKKDWRYEK